MTPAWLPFRSTRAIARALRRRADAARDARQWQLAGGLYEESLALGREDGRVHVQCGHMFKEAGDYERAERHYADAARLLPDDADLALQLGHFYKTADQPALAAENYARALALVPGWDEARRELRLLSGHGPRAATDAGAPPLPDLLPAAAQADEDRRERIVVHRLGAELVRSPTGTWRVLRGVQAIRGYCVSHVPLGEVLLLIDGEVAHRAALSVSARRPDRYVFNIWHDFTSVAVGEREIEIRFTVTHGRARAHRARLLVAPPDGDPARLASDSYVPEPPEGVPLETHIAALPSVVRSADRRVIPRHPGCVLVQRIDQLGDLCCSVPAIRRLRALFPTARLVGLVSHANADLARALGLFDELVVAAFPEQDGHRVMTAAAQQALADDLRRFRFDVAIDLSQADESRPLLLLTGAPFLCGFGIRRFPWLSAGVDFSVPDPLDRLDRIAHGRKASLLVEALAVAMAEAPPPLPRPAAAADADAERRTRYGLTPGRRYVVLHGGARLPFSRWPGFAELAASLLARTDLDILLIDDDAALPQAIVDHPRLRRLAGLLPFDDFDALIAGAALFVGNDSGPKHLASLRGVQVVSLHMARLNWDEWGQERTGLILSRRVPCAGCGIARHPEECGRDFACLRLISPEEVLAAVLSQLGK